jgi:CRP/FNR family cyclic AMP-dependent transcriptional regulator
VDSNKNPIEHDFFTLNRQREIIPVNSSQFYKLIEDDRDFNMELIKTMSNRLFYKSMMLEELANEQAEHRVRTLINYLFKSMERGGVLDVTRQQLADMSGLRVETVIRVVKKLAEREELKLQRGKIIKT